MGLPEKKKPYCGVVALSSLTNRSIPDIEKLVNHERKTPNKKIIGMSVKEILQQLTDSGMEYKIESTPPTPFVKHKTSPGSKLIVLDSYGSDPPHILVSNGDFFIDSDNPRKSHKTVYKYPHRQIKAVIHLTRQGKPIEDFNEVKYVGD